MPSIFKPDLLHILCDDFDYEKKMFEQLKHGTSQVYHCTTKSKQASSTSNAITYCSSFYVTSYTNRVYALGNYKAFYDHNPGSTPFPTLTHPLHPSDCKTFLLYSSNQRSVNTLLVSQNVTNWVTANMLKTIGDAKVNSVFVHLKPPNVQTSPSPRTQAIINFATHNKLQILYEQPETTDTLWMQNLLSKVNTQPPPSKTCIHNWNPAQMKSYKLGANVDLFLLCPMISSNTLVPKLIGIKTFAKNTAFMNKFHTKLIENHASPTTPFKLTSMIDHINDSELVKHILKRTIIMCLYGTSKIMNN